MDLFKIGTLVTLNKASEWASDYLKRKIDKSNISYLVQYGKIHKYSDNGKVLVSIDELKEYYDSYHGKREISWKDKLGDDLNLHLSFDNLREKDTTKHVHRLHPYKGKFIPQLVEYFIDTHKDEFKKQSYFKPGDIILDPFCGSGTTLIQANELGLHAVGIDVSKFNSLISNVKVRKYNLIKLKKSISEITEKFNHFIQDSINIKFERRLVEELNIFNSKYFPSPDFKLKVNKNMINEFEYGAEMEKEFLPIYNKLLKKFKIDISNNNNSFLDIWYLKPVRQEIEFLKKEIMKYKNQDIQNILKVILSRTIRSCRATTHSDLATLMKPVYHTYYCRKHRKICKPLFTCSRWWKRYSIDTLKRLDDFSRLRTDTNQLCLAGDSRTIDIFKQVKRFNKKFGELILKNKISGIFTSPPYVGLIDYHEQHAYSYELFNFKRKDELEIGPLFKGRGKEARNSYVEGLVKVLINCKKFMKEDFNIFIVANDKFNLYPEIAEKSGLKIVKTFKRPVLNRTEKDKNAYSEIIFHLKGKEQ